ncbi:MAG: ABC transporter permease [Pseudomonadota bacterium]
MFQTRINRSKRHSLIGMLEVTYHTIVRNLRTGHRNAVVGMLLNMVQGLTLVAAFFFIFQLLGLRSSPIRGDFLLFIMSGVFLYLTHIKSVSAVMSAGSPTAPMNLHAPMNPVIAIISAALATLYTQLFTIIVVLSIYHIAFTPVVIDDPIPALGIFILAWFSGCAVGTIFLSLNPWFPNFTPIAKNLYVRINMIASGKMFVVNTLPATMVALFDWNPLFHIIDQMRGFVFLHYNPHVTSISYPVYVSLTLLVLGMMGEFYSRRHVSLSWFAGR